MKIVFSTLDHEPKTVYIADKEKGWVMGAGYEFKIHDILFAAIPMQKTKEIYVIHVESGQLLFSPDMQKSIADDADTLMAFIKEKVMVPAAIIIEKEGVELIKAENRAYVRQSFDLFGPKPESEYLKDMDIQKFLN